MLWPTVYKNKSNLRAAHLQASYSMSMVHHEGETKTVDLKAGDESVNNTSLNITNR